jgi:hypothetical protein
MALTIVAGPAGAQPSARNPAAAQALYDEARQLAEAGRYADACPKFKESYQLDAGGGTLLNLADCYEKQGQTALAWTTFKDALVAARHDGRNDRVEFANQHIGSLENRLARLTVSVPAVARVAGLSVALDGSPLGEAAWGVAMPVDPGKHIVRAEAPGKRPFETSIDVPSASAIRQTVEVPTLADAPADKSTVATVPAVAPIETGNEGGSSRATAGWIVGGAGLASVGLATYFGVRAFSRWSDRNALCAGGCTEAAKSAGTDANEAATISDVGFGVGLAAVAVGTYLVLSGRSETPASRAASSPRVRIEPRAVHDGAGVWIGGNW